MDINDIMSNLNGVFGINYYCYLKMSINLLVIVKVMIFFIIIIK